MFSDKRGEGSARMALGMSGTYCLSSRLLSLLLCGLGADLVGALFFSHMRLRFIVRGVGGGIMRLNEEDGGEEGGGRELT